MFGITAAMHHRVHRVSHGPGRGKGSGLGEPMPLSRSIRGGSGAQRHAMKNDLDSGHNESGIHGGIAHGLAIGLLGRKMTAIRGAHIILAIGKDLQNGGREMEAEIKI